MCTRETQIHMNSLITGVVYIHTGAYKGIYAPDTHNVCCYSHSTALNTQLVSHAILNIHVAPVYV